MHGKKPLTLPAKDMPAGYATRCWEHSLIIDPCQDTKVDAFLMELMYESIIGRISKWFWIPPGATAL
jgi:hypothetical protein